MDEARTEHRSSRGGRGGWRGRRRPGDRKERLSTRLARKAELARASRKRRKMYLQELEQKVQRLTARVEELQRRLRKLHSGGGLGTREERVRKEQQSAIKERLTQLIAMSQQLSSSSSSSSSDSSSNGAALPAVVAAAANLAAPPAPSASASPSALGPSSPLASSCSFCICPPPPPSALLPAALLPPPQPVLPPEYQHELQELVTRFVYNCFTASDTQLLTADGFLFVDDVRQRTAADRQPRPSAATTPLIGSIEYHPIGLQQLVDRSGPQQLVRFHAPDCAGGPARHSRARHVRSRRQQRLQASCSARSLLQRADEGAGPHHLRFLACAAAGVSRSLQDWRSLPFVAALGLTSRDQYDAFLLLYGCFLRTGRLDSQLQKHQPAGQQLVQAWDCLDDVFQRSLRSVLPVLARGKTETIRTTRQASSLHCVCITFSIGCRPPCRPSRSSACRLYRIRSARWWRYFAELVPAAV